MRCVLWNSAGWAGFAELGGRWRGLPGDSLECTGAVPHRQVSAEESSSAGARVKQQSSLPYPCTKALQDRLTVREARTFGTFNMCR